MSTNMYGQAILSSDNLRSLLLQGKNISHLNVEYDDDISLYQKYQSLLLPNVITFSDKPDESLTFDEFHNKSSGEWIFPVIYQQVDVLTWLLAKCKTQVEIDRVNEEYIMYKERDLIMMLRLFIYIISYLRQHNHVWGVGRGSSVNSFILYLIGTHFVNSIKYNLNIADFLK